MKGIILTVFLSICFSLIYGLKVQVINMDNYLEYLLIN